MSSPTKERKLNAWKKGAKVFGNQAKSCRAEEKNKGQKRNNKKKGISQGLAYRSPLKKFKK